ncbi:RidA family protein [Constantimarinum furrinae]|uniref:Endoribonuclease L-PSP n=1 Tax=Constantimarinum furrinae TaxID=2562285 RepID=A0A7G8PUU0_9FLAO|nr:RidA family protein [Constantimarinum furrinae]QNJ98106.1 endoribonuclease L-PSP [Constantimarinum furrinae]
MKLFIPVWILSTLFFGMAGCTDQKNRNEKSMVSENEQNVKPDTLVFYDSHEPEKQDLPFSDVVQVGNLYFLSGQIGMDHGTRKLVSGGITAETVQTLENIKAVLEHHNLRLTQVVKVMVILDDIDDFSAFNEVYITYFPQKPARTTFAAEALAKGAKIEIEVVAAANTSSENN